MDRFDFARAPLGWPLAGLKDLIEYLCELRDGCRWEAAKKVWGQFVRTGCGAAADRVNSPFHFFWGKWFVKWVAVWGTEAN